MSHQIPHANIGKKGLLDWLNDFYHFNYTKIEECASGAALCQILDSLYPGTVPLAKVNFNAKLEHEFIANFKVFQTALLAHGIDKYVDVPKLVKAKFQDNLEFMQWMKGLFDAKYNNQPYDAVARRDEAKSQHGKVYKAAKHPAGGAPDAAPTHPAPKPAAHTAPAAERKPVRAAPASSSTSSSTSATKSASSSSSSSSSSSASSASTTPAPRGAAAATGVARRPVGGAAVSASGPGARKDPLVASLNAQLADLKAQYEHLATEKAFYYGKLREIELMCREGQGKVEQSTKDAILAILYKTEFFNEEDVVVPEDAAATDAGAAAGPGAGTSMEGSTGPVSPTSRISSPIATTRKQAATLNTTSSPVGGEHDVKSPQNYPEHDDEDAGEDVGAEVGEEDMAAEETLGHEDGHEGAIDGEEEGGN